MGWKSGFELVVLLWALGGSASWGKEDFSPFAVVRVDGMSCYTCLYTLEKSCKIQKLDNGAVIDLKRGLARIKLDSGKPIPKPELFERLVLDSGFTFRWVELELMGQIQRSGDSYVVVAERPLQEIPVWLSEGLGSLGELKKLNGRQSMRLKLRAEGKKPKGWTLVLAEAASDGRGG